MILSEWYDHRDQDTGVASANATPQAVVQFGPNREGYIWYIEKLNFHVIANAAHTAIVKAYVSTGILPDPTDASRQAILNPVIGTASTDGDRDFINPILVPPGYNLLVVFTGGTLAQNDQVEASLQRAWCLTANGSAYGSLSPREKTSLIEQEAVEAAERAAAVVVGGSSWPPDVESMGGDNLAPWASRNPADAADDPAEPSQILGGGAFIHGA